MRSDWKNQAFELDKEDDLRGYKKEFYLPTGIYLDGNSLGLLSTRAEAAVHACIDDWKHRGINGWSEGPDPWFYFADELAAQSAELIGAYPEEVAVTGSITVNLHQLLTTFFEPQKNKNTIVMDSLAFPTDVYAVKSQLQLHGLDPDKHLTFIPSRDGANLEEEDIFKSITENTALVLLPSVLYRSGQLLDWKRITEKAHSYGALIGWDLAHSFGAVPHDLHESGVDFAVWCTYKYANSGPGGTAGLFVHKKHHGQTPGLAGWFGSDKQKQFDMEAVFSPAEDASAFQLGTPNVLSMAPLKGSLEMILEAGIDSLRSRSLKLTSFIREGLQELTALDDTLKIVTPELDRGGHIALTHPDAARLCKGLKEAGVIPDFRSPDIIRLAPSPLYSSFDDLAETLIIFEKLLETKSYKKYKNERDIIA
ncbi:kynureninase [Alkalicoccus halolimnae]|uniref:Kynureninase n=1 Tax=Alkalicoccus halolimnae TaxID=1667239 RepID=A0A5C7F3A4_9BACI|nr:kynureninase [Alkalicoccus halolimnae]TXF85092.1 kynureninase [Alkalicoccus halolimnae]